MKRQFIVNDEVIVKDIKPPKNKKWCPYDKHWAPIASFRTGQTYCKPCTTLYMRERRSKKLKDEKEQLHQRKLTVLQEMRSRVEALEQILADILLCTICQSRGYIYNHENKIFVCDCRLVAKQKVVATKAAPSCS